MTQPFSRTWHGPTTKGPGQVNKANGHETVGDFSPDMVLLIAAQAAALTLVDGGKSEHTIVAGPGPSRPAVRGAGTGGARAEDQRREVDGGHAAGFHNDIAARVRDVSSGHSGANDPAMVLSKMPFATMRRSGSRRGNQNVVR